MDALDSTLPSPDRPMVALAPMAGITDLPFRRLVARFGVDWTVSEMVASRELLDAHPATRARAELSDGRVVQIAGRAPEVMAECARMLADQGAREVDVNMGCPAKKVTGGASGAALMRDLGLAARILDAVVAACLVPVTLKMRLGWDDAGGAAELSALARAAGVARIAVHGRTRAQFYKGRADWGAAGPALRGFGGPGLINGDVVDAATARAALAASGASGVLIGRGAQGAPWVPAQVRAALAGRPGPVAPTGRALVDLVAGHHDAMLSFYGRALGVRVARKHLGWYMDRAATPPGLRRAVLTAQDPGPLLAEALDGRVAA
ncbi:MAG: tRNA dihydrouridine synthase [Paracoccaceae bacterium]